MDPEEKVVMLMRAAKVTPNEALAFMATALVNVENGKVGSANAFMTELVELRGTRKVPDASRWMW